MLRLALAFCLVATTATAQDVLAQARSIYSNVQGEWAEPDKSCADPADTWSFGPNGVRAGLTRFNLLGIGGGGGAIRVDLVSVSSGARVPLNLMPQGEALEVTGSGIAVRLTRCIDRTFAREIPVPEADAEITSRSLDEDPRDDLGDLGPSTAELRQALDNPSDEMGVGPEIIEDTSAEDAFANQLAGAWASGGGACDWRLSSDRITAAGETYDVVNYSGTPDRIGVQALRSDGTPATFTVRPSGNSAQIDGSVANGEGISASLSPC